MVRLKLQQSRLLQFHFPFLVALTLLLLAPFWHFRFLYTTPVDPEYLRDYYDHSQWRMPLSQRIMGDSPLYQYAGWHIGTGGGLFEVNPEVPPIGKYLFFFSQVLLGTPYAANALHLALALLAFALVARQFLSPKQTWAALLLFAAQPLLWSQLGSTLLDLGQLAFFLWWCAAILHLLETKKFAASVLWSTVAAISLAGFVGTKFGALAIIPVAAAVFPLWKKGKFFWIIPIGLSAIGLYMSTYLAFFLQGNSVLDWLRAQKWMYAFYSQSSIEHQPWMMWWTTISMQYEGWWGGGKEMVREWTALWSFGLLSFLLFWWQKRRHLLQQPPQALFLGLLTAGFLGAYTLIPYWPRYTLLLLPLFALSFAKVATKKLLTTQLGMAALLLTLFLPYLGYFMQGPQSQADLFETYWQTGSYPEAFFTLKNVQGGESTWREWSQKRKSIDHTLQSEKRSVSFTFSQRKPWNHTQFAQAEFIYSTPLGEIRETIPVEWVRSGHTWQMVWTPEMLGENMAHPLRAEFLDPPGAVLYDQEGTVVSEPGNQLHLSIVPEKVARIEEVLVEAHLVTGQDSPEELRIRLFHSSPSNQAIDVGWVLPYADPELLAALQETPGVFLTQRPNGRVYHPLASEKALSEIVQFEQNRHGAIFGSRGGKISEGETVLIERPATASHDTSMLFTLKPEATPEAAPQQ